MPTKFVKEMEAMGPLYPIVDVAPDPDNHNGILVRYIETVPYFTVRFTIDPKSIAGLSKSEGT
jgi:hypothetical protein